MAPAPRADRVVAVVPELVHPPRSGGTIRTARLLAALAEEMPVDIVAVGTRAPEDVFVDALGVSSVRFFEGRSGVAARGVALAHGLPPSWGRIWSSEARATIRTAVAAGSTPVFELMGMAVYRPRGIPYVLSLQNADSELIRTLPSPGIGWRQLERALEIRMLRSWERRLARDSLARHVVVSERDARLLGVDALVVPNGTDLAPATPVPARGTLLFVGSLDYFPNAEAVRWWAHEVWPHAAPGTPPLVVAGRGGDSALADLRSHPGVRLLGEVDDVGPLLREAALVAVPLRSGGGTRLKILEAAAWNRPVLTTPKGVEGLPLRHGRDVWVADTPEDFAHSVTSLLGDRSLRERLAGAGRTIAELHTWAVITPRFVECVKQVMEQRRLTTR